MMGQSGQALPASAVAHPVLPSFNLKKLLNTNASLIYSELAGLVTMIIVHLVVLLASCHVAAAVPWLVLVDLAHDLVLHVRHLHLVADIVVAQGRQATRFFNSAQKQNNQSSSYAQKLPAVPPLLTVSSIFAGAASCCHEQAVPLSQWSSAPWLGRPIPSAPGPAVQQRSHSSPGASSCLRP